MTGTWNAADLAMLAVLLLSMVVGVWRGLTLRESARTGEVMLVLVAKPPPPPLPAAAAAAAVVVEAEAAQLRSRAPARLPARLQLPRRSPLHCRR